MGIDIHEECGVFGAFRVEHAAEVTYYAMHAMQHRGQEGCGMVTADGKHLVGHRSYGLVKEVFTQSHLDRLVGNYSIGHVRYATSGSGHYSNIQPFLFYHSTGDFALCHNGNIVNSTILREEFEKNGSIFQSTSDSEILAHLITKRSYGTRTDALKYACSKLEGGFSFLVLTKDKLYAMRDKNGLRPLSLGKLGDGYVVSSETCAFDVIGAEFIRDILPGEIIKISKDGIVSTFYDDNCFDKMCAMEYIYFARPDSDINGINVHLSRKEVGKALARECPVDCDIIIGVPDSSLSAANGFSEESGIPLETGLIKNKYMGRTFIEPSQDLRERGVKMKLSPIRSVVKGKRVCVIDDSIVRGTTSKQIVQMLREQGAVEVHMRVASPPMIAPCFYGVDTSTYEELISSYKSVDEVCKIIGTDSLGFISKEGFLKAIGAKDLCMACFDRQYPTPLYEDIKNANKNC
ncbi:MAG: amidophosphoribosyltransferase [Spirochaetales bacterium]|uniref:amidophosphoribosyltransferase n=1 Tax=Bullifex sp. TaxID=2815808 RepID=UPI002A515100|nr:amidophosphoribosyltransferase [Bullifex sp.]MDD7271776.1 amidophosphoribosyltransferase [Spirochaetales bacterium]MDY4067987.1 amidophosphoribosyltransferase [Bullifex sp.]